MPKKLNVRNDDYMGGTSVRLTEKEYNRLLAYMHENFGLNLKGKQTLIEGRLSSHLQKNGFADYSSYIDFVMADKTGQEVGKLISRLTTNYTFFMREEQHFDFLTGTVLPEILPRIKDRDLRIWSAACSSGEEPYSLAMVLMNYFSRITGPWDHTVLATDISENVLTLARAGIYPVEAVKNLSESFRRSYFTKVDDQTLRVSDEVRNQVVFGFFNLMDKHIPFRKKFHVIFCRNVMIYFDAPTKEALVQRFAERMEVGGYLMVGHSETLTNLNCGLKQVRPSIYRKEG